MQGLMMIMTAAAFAGLALATSACASPEPVRTTPLVDVRAAEFADTQRTDEGRHFTFDMGENRVNWNNARWSIVGLDGIQDLTAYDGIRLTVTTDTPRDDAGVYLAIRESDGSWYYVAWAANLTRETNHGTARFVDFSRPYWSAPSGGAQGHFDANNRLDLDQIDQIAIGVINPLGVGEVSFTVTAIELVALEPQQTEPVAIEVTGRMLDVNNTDAIPAGLFGSFNLPRGHTERYRLASDRRIHHEGLRSDPVFGNEITHMMVNCQGDRVRPSTRLTHPDWRERLERAGREYGERAAADGRPSYVEYWNEPYLNWANHNRANFNPRFFDVSRAEEGGPVHIRHDGQEAPHLRWTRNFEAPPWQWTSERDWRRGRDAQGRVYSPVHAPPYAGMQAVYGGNWQPQFHPPLDVKDGETYAVQMGGRQVELEAFTPWHIYDETQFTYWSGRGMKMLYHDPMMALGTALKAAHPETIFFVGWDFRPSEDHWAAFHMLYRHTIDVGIDIIDGIADHDYGGDPTRMAANYEVVTAYGVVQHDRWLYNFNTETAMGTDPQAYPEAEGLGRGPQADRAKFEWTTTKLLHALQFVPDKARNFAWFGYGGGWWSDSGEGVAMDLLINLRGRLVQVVNPDPHVYVVAAIDGTDPRNPRPETLPDRRELVVAILNDHRSAREIDLTINAPQGTSFQQAIVREPAFTGEQGQIRIVTLERNTDPQRFTLRHTLPDKGIVVVTLPLAGDVPEAPQAWRTQHFGPTILADVKLNQPLSQAIAIDADRLQGARRAWVRFVAERLDEGEATVEINGTTYALPRAVTPDNTPYLRQMEIDPAILRQSNQLTFRIADDRHAGFLLAMNSIIVERE